MRVVKIALSAVLALAAACSSADEPSRDTSQDAPTATPTAVTVSSTVTSPAAPIAPPPFNPDDYANGNEIIGLIAEVGPERPYPSELLPDSPELPNDLAKALAEDFLNDSRVVITMVGFRDETVDFVEDYCDNGVKRTIYVRPDLEADTFMGFVRHWTVAHTSSTDWNSPYITSGYHLRNPDFYTFGIDGLGFPRLGGPDEVGKARFGYRNHVHVFDNPACADPIQLTAFDSTQWELLDLGELVSWPDELRPSSPQLEPRILERMWEEEYVNILVFDNLNGYPRGYTCEDQGVMLNRISPQAIGKVYDWSIEDGSEIANNGAWFIYDYHDPGIGTEREFFFVPDDDEFHPDVFAVEINDCSIEDGLAIADQIRAELNLPPVAAVKNTVPPGEHFNELKRRPFPSILHDSADVLDSADAAQVWTEWLTNGRLAYLSDGEIGNEYLLCAYGVGTVIKDGQINGEPLEWSIAPYSAGSWNEITFTFVAQAGSVVSNDGIVVNGNQPTREDLVRQVMVGESGDQLNCGE